MQISSMTDTTETTASSMVHRVVPVGKDFAQEWDRFVERHPDGTMYHLMGWREVLERTFGYDSYYLASIDADGQLTGVLPLFVMTDILRHKYLVSNPFSNFAGICASSPEARWALLKHAIEIAHREQAQYIELRQLGSPLVTPPFLESLPAKDSFVTLMLSLDPDPESHWKGLSSRNRGKVRKAMRAGIEAVVDTRYLGEFYSIFTKNLRHLGTPAHPVSLFENILSVFPERSNILVLKIGDKVVSGMFLFRFRDTIAEPWVSSLREYHSLYVNNLLYWKAIEHACQNGFRRFDFGRSTVGTGTYRFKLQWGADPIRLYYHYYLNLADEIPVVDAVNNQYERYIEIWKKLPLWLTRIVGPRLVKYLPQL